MNYLELSWIKNTLKLKMKFSKISATTSFSLWGRNLGTEKERGKLVDETNGDEDGTLDNRDIVEAKNRK